FSHYRLYATAPVFFVNVLDPAKHKTTVTVEAYPVANRQAVLPFEAIAESVTVSNYNRGEDFELFYDDKSLVLEIIEGGNIPPGVTELSVGFDAVDPSLVTKADIIGGFNVMTKQTTGLELIDEVFPRFGIVPDLIICPGFSQEAEVAAVMTAKAASINGIFEAKALIDVNTGTVKHFADVPAWKRENNINDKRQILLFPKFKLDDRVFNASTQAAGLIGRTDTRNNGAPSESPSNKQLQINGAVLDDGTEVILDIEQANFLNSNGIVTALNFRGGFVLWGNETACFPANTDVKDYFIPVSRMFGWVANSVILTYWNQVDRKMSRRFIESIVDSVNIWLNGLVAEEHLLGGRVEFRNEDNTMTALMSGKATFRIFMTPPSPAREIEFVLEYDPSYVTAALIV
ncbi:MAG: phage tail protein, partial [Oscillospiraceae bacterium]|nr:phage tail protein [Oscillospiraceae bacterium]